MYVNKMGKYTDETGPKPNRKILKLRGKFDNVIYKYMTNFFPGFVQVLQ